MIVMNRCRIVCGASENILVHVPGSLNRIGYSEQVDQLDLPPQMIDGV